MQIASVPLEGISQRCGYLWGRYFVRLCLRYLDRRCAAFPLSLTGVQHLRKALEEPCLIVANHVLIKAEDAPMGRLTQSRLLLIFNKPPDSFIFRRIVREETGLLLHVVAQSDRGWWSPRPLVKVLQKRIGQPFGKGLMEGMNFIPVEHNSGSFHRSFFQSATETIRRGRPILIFPGRLLNDNDGCHDLLIEGHLTEAPILPGAAHLARKLSLVILPTYIQGCDSWRPDKPTQIVFGQPFSALGMTKAEINLAILSHVRGLMVPQQDSEQEISHQELIIATSLPN